MQSGPSVAGLHPHHPGTAQTITAQDAAGVASQNRSLLITLEDVAKRYGLDEDAEAIRDRIRDSELPPMIVIAGEGNFGKSSLVNALLGREIAPVSRRPLTWKVDVYWPTDDGTEFALIRRTGAATSERLSFAEAREVVDHEEQLLRADRSRRPEIVEVIWRFSAPLLPATLALVDTPGISADGLGVSVCSERLVRGLGAVYRVDDVWHYYYHRADVVLWVFEATQMESDASARVLRDIVNVYQKNIVPVATKIDRVDRERWPEVAERFRTAHRALIEDGHINKELYLTACGARGQLAGYGADKLRDYLQNVIVPQAEHVKGDATRKFVRDTAVKLSHVLSASSNQLVANVRTIADTADEVALNTMREIKRTRDAVELLAQMHVRERWSSVTKDLQSLGIKVVYHDITLDQFRNAITDLLDVTGLATRVRTAFEELCSQVRHLALATSKTRTLHKATVGNTGVVTEDAFGFQLELPKVPIPTFEIAPAPVVPPLRGAIDLLWGFAKNIFGSRALTQDEERWLSNYRSTLERYANELPHQAVQEINASAGYRLGTALADAAEAAVADFAHMPVHKVISELVRVDADVAELERMAGQESPGMRRTAEWVRYWTAQERDVTLVRKLLAEVAASGLNDMKEYIESQIPPLPNTVRKYLGKGVRRHATIYLTHSAVNIEQEAGDGERSWPDMFRTVLRPVKMVIASFKFIFVSRPALLCGEWIMEGWLTDLNKRHIGPSDELVSWLRSAAQEDRTIGRLVERTQEEMPDVVLSRVREEYASMVGELYADALMRSASDLEARAEYPCCEWAGCALHQIAASAPLFLTTGAGPALFTVPLWLAHYAGRPLSLFAEVAICIIDIPVVTAGLMIAVGSLLAKGMLRRALKEDAQKVIAHWAKKGCVDVAAHLDAEFMQELANRFAVHVNPRPLTRLKGGLYE